MVCYTLNWDTLIDDSTILKLVTDSKIRTKYRHLITNSFVKAIYDTSYSIKFFSSTLGRASFHVYAVTRSVFIVVIIGKNLCTMRSGPLMDRQIWWRLLDVQLDRCQHKDLSLFQTFHYNKLQLWSYRSALNVRLFLKKAEDVILHELPKFDLQKEKRNLVELIEALGRSNIVTAKQRCKWFVLFNFLCYFLWLVIYRYFCNRHRKNATHWYSEDRCF